MKPLQVFFLLSSLFFSVASIATPASDELLQRYQEQGATAANLIQAERDWTHKVKTDGKNMSCTTCHGTDFTQSGKHPKTGKRIDPMSPTVEPNRYSSTKKIEKWFKRSCKDAWGRECTPQEKTNFLTYLLTK